MQMRLLLTPIREAAQSASIPHLPKCCTGGTQWFPALHGPTGNYCEPERGRGPGGRGSQVSQRVTGRCFIRSVWGEHGFACWVKCQRRLWPHPLSPKYPHANTRTRSVTGNYGGRATELCEIRRSGLRSAPCRPGSVTSLTASSRFH